MGRLEALLERHAKIDADIILMQSQPTFCNLALSTLKKQKLFVKDTLVRIRTSATHAENVSEVQGV